MTEDYGFALGNGASVRDYDPMETVEVECKGCGDRLRPHTVTVVTKKADGTPWALRLTCMICGNAEPAIA
jgi:hypothetical protein